MSDLVYKKEEQAKFEGWAVVELFGHVKEAGWVETKYFGSACFFEIRVPGLPERESQLQYPAWGSVAMPTLGGEEILEERRLPVGAIVKVSAIPERLRLVGASAIYSLNPCTQAEVITAVKNENRHSEKLTLVSMPAAVPVLAEPQDRTFSCCGGNPEDGHREDCAAGMDDEEEAPR